jgi:hypothetical protein
MVEVQDELQESVDDNKDEMDVDKFADKYIQRRGINTSKPFTSRLVSIGYIENSEEIGAKIKTPDIDLVVKLGSTDEIRGSNLINFLSECPREIISKKHGIKSNKNFDIWISDDLRRCGFSEDSKKYKIEIKDPPNIDDNSKRIISDIYPYYLYKRLSGNKPGVKTNIKSVNGISEEILKVKCDLTSEKELEWKFDIPFQVDINEHPVAELIEEQGNGDPRNLNQNSDIYVIHREDLIGRIRPVGFDTTGEWALVTVNEYKKWRPHLYTTDMSSSMEKRHTVKFAISYLLYVLITLGFIMILTEFVSVFI